MSKTSNPILHSRTTSSNSLLFFSSFLFPKENRSKSWYGSESRNIFLWGGKLRRTLVKTNLFPRLGHRLHGHNVVYQAKVGRHFWGEGSTLQYRSYARNRQSLAFWIIKLRVFNRRYKSISRLRVAINRQKGAKEGAKNKPRWICCLEIYATKYVITTCKNNTNWLILIENDKCTSLVQSRYFRGSSIISINKKTNFLNKFSQLISCCNTYYDLDIENVPGPSYYPGQENWNEYHLALLPPSPIPLQGIIPLINVSQRFANRYLPFNIDDKWLVLWQNGEPKEREKISWRIIPPTGICLSIFGISFIS